MKRNLKKTKADSFNNKIVFVLGVICGMFILFTGTNFYNKTNITKKQISPNSHVDIYSNDLFNIKNGSLCNSEDPQSARTTYSKNRGLYTTTLGGLYYSCVNSITIEYFDLNNPDHVNQFNFIKGNKHVLSEDYLTGTKYSISKFYVEADTSQSPGFDENKYVYKTDIDKIGFWFVVNEYYWSKSTEKQIIYLVENLTLK
jgi:hypothetical protein